MTDPRSLAEKARKLYIREGPTTHLAVYVPVLADALIAALDDLEEQRGNAEGFWEENERLREAAQVGAIRLDDAPTWAPRHFPAALTETPEREA